MSSMSAQTFTSNAAPPGSGGQVGAFPLAREVLGELGPGRVEARVVTGPERGRVRPVPVMREVHADQLALIGHEGQPAYRRVDDRVAGGHGSLLVSGISCLVDGQDPRNVRSVRGGNRYRSAVAPPAVGASGVAPGVPAGVVA